MDGTETIFLPSETAGAHFRQKSTFEKLMLSIFLPGFRYCIRLEGESHSKGGILLRIDACMETLWIMIWKKLQA